MLMGIVIIWRVISRRLGFSDKVKIGSRKDTKRAKKTKC